MNASKLAGMVLIVAGLLGLVYGGFSYTKDTTVVKLGPIELTAKEKERVNVPLWAGVGAIVAGVVLLSLGGRKGGPPRAACGPRPSLRGDPPHSLRVRSTVRRVAAARGGQQALPVQHRQLAPVVRDQFPSLQ
jgi:hypothetical protein